MAMRYEWTRIVLKDTKGWGEEGIGGKYPFGYISMETEYYTTSAIFQM